MLHEDEEVDHSSDSELDGDGQEGPKGISSTAPSPLKRRARRDPQKLIESNGPIIFETQFDAFFTLASSNVRTSTNVFSSLVDPLSPEEYVSLVASSSSLSQLSEKSQKLEEAHEAYFPHYLLELSQGFNLLFYGFGSKRQILNKFASSTCSRKGHVVVVNSFLPTFSLKDLLSSVERNVPEIDSLPLQNTAVETRTRRIYDFFGSSSQRIGKRLRPLFLVIHNIDSTNLRTPQAKSCLSLLALNPRIHLVASVDHINAPLLWSRMDVTARKHGLFDESDERSSSRGYNWLWHELTTFVPYDFELSHADRSSYSGASAPNLSRANAQLDNIANVNVVVSESSAIHVLASVTQKAKRLFVLLAKKQLETASQDIDSAKVSLAQLQQYAISYDLLFQAARDDFIATNDTALKALLGEFRDHGLILRASSSEGGDVMWIPMHSNLLKQVLSKLEKD